MPKIKVKEKKRKPKVRMIKVEPLSKDHREAMKRLVKSEHEPIQSDALIYTGRRSSRQ